MYLRPVILNGNCRFSLQIDGAQDEYGVGEYAFVFEAHLAALTDEVDICSIKGMLIDHEHSDTCVKVSVAHVGITPSRSLHIYKGTVAHGVPVRRTDVRVRVRGESILFLYGPVIHDLCEDKMPGARLIASLKKHFIGRNMGIVLDLGTLDEDPSFRDYFFSGLGVHDLRFLDHRLALGHWGQSNGSEGGTYTFTAIYD